jgi:transcription antitermination factor NusG
MNAAPNPGSVSSSLDNVMEAPCWYVAYTYPRHERAVADQLERKSVEAFLPTFTQTSQWKDRRVKLELPLFPGYVFARMPAAERVKVLSIPSVIRMLSYRGALAPVSDDEIDTIRLFITRGAKVRPHRYLAVGDLVRVREGVFEGVQGIVVRENNGCRLVVSIGLIQQSVGMEIDADSLEYVGPSSGSIHTRPLGRAFANASVRV